MSQADNDSTTTDHPRVVYEDIVFDRCEFEVATRIADAIDPEWAVVVTIGAYRAHNISYDLDPGTQTVHLDFYSVRPASGYDFSTVINHSKS